MQENVGTVDRWIRVGVGTGLVAAGLGAGRGRPLGPVALVALGALVLESALTRVCPVNALLGVNTRVFDGGKVRVLAEPSGSSAVSTSPGIGAAQRLPADS